MPYGFFTHDIVPNFLASKCEGQPRQEIKRDTYKEKKNLTSHIQNLLCQT